MIPVMTQHYTMLQRNLLYTGVTRGKRLVVLVGQKKAVAIAVRSVSGRRRWSKLCEWLRSPAAKASGHDVRITTMRPTYLPPSFDFSAVSVAPFPKTENGLPSRELPVSTLGPEPRRAPTWVKTGFRNAARLPS